MSKKNQEIVPVRLSSEKKHASQSNLPQKLVARVKSDRSELFVYEEIHDQTLCVLLKELISNETH